MIIDAHSHFWEKDTLFSGDMKRLAESLISRELKIKDPNKFYDGSLERLIGDMDEAGIDKTVLLPLDIEFNYTGSLTFREFNNMAKRYLKGAPDRIIAFAGIDPRRGVAGIEELKRCVQDMGFVGIKLWNVTGFFPEADEYYPLYEEAARLGVNIMVHTGLGPFDTYLRACQPVRVDKIAVDFREINFIMAHVGTPWVDEAIAVAGKNPNVYVDLSAWQAMYVRFPLGLSQMLSQAKLMHGGVDKVLFGSDWPLFTDMCPQKTWVEAIRSLAHPQVLQIMGLPEITDEDKEKILGLNAQQALKL